MPEKISVVSSRRHMRWLLPLLVMAVVLYTGYVLYRNPPVQHIAHGETGIRTNLFTGKTTRWQPGSVIVWPHLHSLRVLSLRDHLYKPADISVANGPAPLQSQEGLSLGAQVTVRYALDESYLDSAARLPEDIEATIVAPALQGIIYRIFSQYTVREIFSTRRGDIQQALEQALKPILAQDGIVLRQIQIGNIDLPQDYRRGMDALLAEELVSEKMRYTLELKKKQLIAQEMEEQSKKEQRELAAQAAAKEQVIAAQGQEEAMKHIIPFKQRQIEQRKLEAQAAAASRVKEAEGAAEARRIEAQGEADARKRLADAESYRLEQVGKAGAEQMAREGVVLSSHPLLIEKIMAERLSDKVQVIIAPPPASGNILEGALLNRHQ